MVADEVEHIPVCPSSRSGVSPKTSDYVIEAKPLLKKAVAMNTMTTTDESVYFALSMNSVIATP